MSKIKNVQAEPTPVPGQYDEFDQMAGNDCQAGYDQLKKVSSISMVTVIVITVILWYGR